MKKLVLLFSVFTMILASCGNDNPASRIKDENIEKAKQRDAKLNEFPEMNFEVTEIDFGTHNEGDVLDTIFNFTNTGKLPLVITKVKTTCGCTTPFWPKEPIKPGEKSQIKVRFNTNHKPGKQSKTITIHANTKKMTETVKIKAYINPKDKKKAESMKKVNSILKNKINPNNL